MSYNKKPELVLSDKAFQKIMYWVKKATGEISGLGTVEVKDGKFYILDAFLLPQKNGAAHTDIEAEDVCTMMYERRNDPGQINFWWHSHVNMSAFWSGTDTDTMDKLAAGGWFVSTVFNKRSETRSALTMVNKSEIEFEGEANKIRVKKDGSVYLFIDDLPTRIERYLDKEFMEALDKEYDLNCKPAYVPQTWHDWQQGYEREGDSLSNQGWMKMGHKWRKKFNKKRGMKKDGKFYFLDGSPASEIEVDVPEHLNFDDPDRQEKALLAKGHSTVEKNRQLVSVETPKEEKKGIDYLDQQGSLGPLQ